MEIRGAWMCLVGMWVLSRCNMEPKHHFGTTLKGTTFFHLTILGHQNTKTAAFQLSKNDWVRPLFGVFRVAREKLFVTVAFDHPVINKLFIMYDYRKLYINISNLKI